MNGLEAILAMCALLAAIGVLIAIVNEERTNVNDSTDTLLAKNEAEKCISIIDSIFSNSAEKYAGKLECTPNGNQITFQNKTTKGYYYTLTTSNKEFFLEVKTLEHYK